MFHPLDLPLHPLRSTQISCTSGYLRIATLLFYLRYIICQSQIVNLRDSKTQTFRGGGGGACPLIPLVLILACREQAALQPVPNCTSLLTNLKETLQRASAVTQIDRITQATMASRGVQYQLYSVLYQPLTRCNTSQNCMVPYVDPCNEIID